MTQNSRIATKFQHCARENRAALVNFLMAGDPDPKTSLELFKAIAKAGADVIEIGMPFTDPMADGVSIQGAGRRALKAGMTLAKTLALVRAFRAEDNETPLILMGYYNPIYVYGVEKFLRDAKAAGVDGLIVVDLPPEEDEELCLPALSADLSFIRLATPTTDEARLPRVLANTSGFVYYVSVSGVTGAAIANYDKVGEAVRRIKKHCALPVVVGFGVKTKADAQNIAAHADGVVVGTALIDVLARSLDSSGQARAQTVPAVADAVKNLAQGVRR